MNFLEKLNSLMKSKGLNKNTLSQSSGIPYTTIDGWYKKGFANAKLSTIQKLADFLGVSLDYLIRDNITDINYGKLSEFSMLSSEITHIKKYRTLDSHGKEVVDVVLDKETERMQTLAQQAEDEDDEDDVIDVDFASLKASAGNGFQLFDDCPSDKLKVLYNEKTRQADICIQVSGHSMEPVFNDGDILLVRKQPSVNIGEYGIWIINGDTGYVKKSGPDRLISVNDEYDDIYPGEFDEIRCYGKVIGVLDKNWIVE